MAYRQRKSLPPVNSSFFNDKVKELIELREGVRSGWDPAFVTFKELSEYDFASRSDIIGSFTPGSEPTGQVPSPPTNLVVQAGHFGNNLSWTKSVSNNVWYYEVWVSTAQGRSNASLLAVVPHPEETYSHFLGASSTTDDHYYWVRAISWGGLYSTWEPSDAEGGYLVEGDTTYSEITSNVIAHLEDQTVDGFGIVADNFYVTSPGLDDKIPFIVGEVDGVSTIGINGEMVVDGTIYANAIGVDTLSAISANIGTITAGVLQSETWSENQGMQIHLSDGTIKCGGSNNPNFSWEDGEAFIRGTVQVEEGGVISSAFEISGTGYMRSKQGSDYPYLEFSNSGLQLKTSDTGGTYGDFELGVDKLGYGAVVWLMNDDLQVPWYECKEPQDQDSNDMASIHFYDRSADPVGGTYEQGDIAMVTGLMKIFRAGDFYEVAGIHDTETSLSSGTGSIKMCNDNNSNNDGFIEISPGKWVPYWSDLTP